MAVECRFAWRLNAEKTEGFLVVQDIYLATNGRGYFDIKEDITNTFQGTWYAAPQPPQTQI